MSRRTQILLTAAVALVAASAASGQSVPNLSGTYELDPARSDFGPGGAQQRTEVIDHREPKLVITRTIDGIVGTMRYAVDGKRYENTFAETKATSTLAWDGPVLVMTSDLEINGTPATIVDRFSLSADGKTLTIARAFDYQGQPIAQTLVFAKR